MKFKNLLLVLFLGFVCFIGIQDVNAATIEDLVNNLQGGNITNVEYDPGTSSLSLVYNGENYIFGYNSSTLELSGSYGSMKPGENGSYKNDFFYLVQSITSVWFNLNSPNNVTYSYDVDLVIGTIDNMLCKYDLSGVCLSENNNVVEYKIELSDKIVNYVINGYDNTTDTDDGENEGTGTDNPYTGSEDIIICSILLLIVGGFVFTIMRKNGKIAKI